MFYQEQSHKKAIMFNRKFYVYMCYKVSFCVKAAYICAILVCICSYKDIVVCQSPDKYIM